MKRITGWCSGLLVLTIIGQWWYHSQWLLAIVVTLIVVVYQLGMRLLVGNVIEKWLPKKFSPASGWFRVGGAEQQLYKWLKVRQWKKYLPTYEPEKYDIKQHTLEEIIQTMCCAELDHEMMLVGSYLPLILINWFGDPAVFVITSVLASLIEVPFIILQRFNRVRLVRIWERRQ